MNFIPLPAAGFLRRPWKNGLGETLVIAGSGHGEDWRVVEWSLSRTVILNDGPFSDFSGFTRWQVVIEGAGLVLDTPQGEIDLRRRLAPVRYDGGLPVEARLQCGGVGVLNLIARHGHPVALDVLAKGATRTMPAGHHILFAPDDDGILSLAGRPFRLPRGDAARIETDVPVVLACDNTPLIVASVPGPDCGRR